MLPRCCHGPGRLSRGGGEWGDRTLHVEATRCSHCCSCSGLCLDLDWVDDAAAECDRECGAEGGPRDEHEDRPGDPRVVEEQRRSRQIDTCWLTGTGASAAPWLGRGPPMSGRGRMRGWPRRRIPPLTPTAGHGIAPLPALAHRRGRGGRAPAGRRAEPRPLDEFHRDTYRDAFIALVELPPLAGARADNSAISSPELTPSRTKSLMSRECRGVPIRQVLNADRGQNDSR